MSFHKVFGELERMGGLYGSNGFHKGFGELLGNLLVEDVMVKKENCSVNVKFPFLVRRLI